MNMRLGGKVAIVTGAAQGIGLGIARVFAREGAMVVLSDAQYELGLQAAQGIAANDGQTHFHRADVTREADLKSLADAAVARFGGLDIIVNNVGICTVRSAEESTVEEWDRTMAVNVHPSFSPPSTAQRHMRRRGGGRDTQRRLHFQLRGPGEHARLLRQQGGGADADKKLGGGLRAR